MQEQPWTRASLVSFSSLPVIHISKGALFSCALFSCLDPCPQPRRFCVLVAASPTLARSLQIPARVAMLGVNSSTVLRSADIPTASSPLVPTVPGKLRRRQPTSQHQHWRRRLAAVVPLASQEGAGQQHSQSSKGAAPAPTRHVPSDAARAMAGMQSLPEVWAWAAQQYGAAPAIEDPHHHPATCMNYRQLADAIQHFAAGLHALGVRTGDR